MIMHRSKAAQATAGAILAARSLPALLALLVVLSTALLLTSTAQAASASSRRPQMALTGFCSNPINGHCYAQRTWFVGTGGASTAIVPEGAMGCSGCLKGRFITDEMWFADGNSTLCKANQAKACWVEAGVATYTAQSPYNTAGCNPGHDSICLFWADNRPGDSYNEHPVYYLGPYGTDLSGYAFLITITNANGVTASGTTWVVDIQVWYGGFNLAEVRGTSTDNVMNVNAVTIGSELFGTDATAGDFYLEDNQWRDTSGVWHYRTGDGTNNSTGSPPYGHWSVTPSTSSTGGKFVTYDP
jgi:hypothetical protein